MPHQCLKCGNLFPEGTTTILRGCPDCHGTRFFFTREPLTFAERDRLLQQTERDLPALLDRLTKSATPPPTPPPSGPKPPPSFPDRLQVPPAFAPPKGEGELLPDGRLLIKLPKDLRRRVEKLSAGWDYEAPSPVSPPLQSATTLQTPAPPATQAPVVAPPPLTLHLSQETPPETVRIPNQGEYEIDVRRLLENSPVVIQKDGSYVLHLPSLFEMPRQGGKQ